MRVHKVLYEEAFQRLSWQAFEDSTSLPHRQALLELRPSLQELRPSPSKTNYAEMMSSKQFQCTQSAYMKFTDSDRGQTAAFWMSYCYMIELLLQFVRSTRIGDWSLHLQCLHEIFMGFINVTGKTRGQDLASVIMDAIKRWGLDMQQCRGQTYDGASNMSGHINRTAAIIQRDYPLATYVHCTSHW